jgi:hypothetical protein
VKTPSPKVPEQEAAADIQAAELLLGLAAFAGNSGTEGQARQFKAIEGKTVGDEDVEDSEVDELEDQIEGAANSPHDFGEFILLCCEPY